MAVPTSKAELLAAINANFDRLLADLSKVPADRAREPSLEGHAAGSTMSPADLVSYLIGWNELVLKWLEQDDKGVQVDFPETGFKWNQLGLLAQKFYRDYGALDYPQLLRRLQKAKGRLVDTISARPDAELYGASWYGKWTKGRMIQFNTSSPYANARGRIRKWLKSQSPIGLSRVGLDEGAMRDLRICFVGDSYINGSGDERCLGWIGRLCERRFTRQIRLTFYDLGIRGATTDEIRGCWKRECLSRFPDGADNRVVLQFGINDVAEIVGSGRRVKEDDSVENAEAIASEVAGSYPTLWVGLPPANVACSPMHPSEGMEIEFSQDTAVALNRRFIASAAKLGLPYLDIQTPLLANQHYMDSLTRGDRMHCDGSGYAIIADLVDDWKAWSSWFEE